jgi:hypothetical protein
MLETKFFVAGSNQEEALKHTCELACKLFFKKSNLPAVENIDILCDTALEAESLDELLWSYPKDALIPHKLAHKDNQEVFAEIGYPGYLYALIYEELVHLWGKTTTIHLSFQLLKLYHKEYQYFQLQVSYFS